MEAKEAIEFLLGYHLTFELNETCKKRDEVISLLQRGEKYEAIVNDIDNNYGFFSHNYVGSNSTDCIDSVLKRLKQKYFPKGGTIW